MSNFTRPTKSFGVPLVKYESTMAVRNCWGCGCEIVYNPRARGKPKICEDCKLLPDEKIKEIYNNHYKNMREQIKAKKYDDKSQDRFIFNSPFRKE